MREMPRVISRNDIELDCGPWKFALTETSPGVWVGLAEHESLAHRRRYPVWATGAYAEFPPQVPLHAREKLMHEYMGASGAHHCKCRHPHIAAEVVAVRDE